MQTIAMLTNEIPWLMAPASLIAAMVVISVITVVIRLAKEESQMMVVWVILVLTMGVLMMRMMAK
jgi:hypothetical protein